jgi:molecular chaperone Hsp33
MTESTIFRAMTHDGSARILVLDSTAIVSRATEVHKTAPTATAALGRLLTAASMIGSLSGEKTDTVTLGIHADGELGKLLAVADYYGNVKGYVENPCADPARKPNGKLDVGGAVGGGYLYLVREKSEGEPHVGTVALQSGEIAEDVAAYFAESEQIPTLCALGVLVNSDGSCKAAGGVLVQLLPFADPATVDVIEKNADNLRDISSLIASGKSLIEIASIALEGVPFDPFDTIEVEYLCDCSHARFLRGIRSLAESEISRMLDEQEAETGERTLHVDCRFCGKKYAYSEAELLKKEQDSE